MRKVVHPKYTITITAILAGLMMLTGFLVIRRASSNMLKVMEQEGIALTNGLIQSSKNVLKAGSIIEPIFFERLLSHAKYVAKLSQIESITREELTTIATENGLSRIDIFDTKGDLKISSSSYPKEIKELIAPILDGEASELPLGIVGEDFGVAVKSGKGVIACYVDASYIKDFKKEVGIGSLIEAMSKGVVEYIVLQDREGIVFASKSVREMKKLNTDPFLMGVLSNNKEASRIYSFEGHNVLEVVKPFIIDNTPFGIFRVGLSLSNYNEIIKENRRHIIVLVAIIFLVGAVVFSLVIANQNYAILDKSYTEIKTLTGSILESMGSAVVAVDATGRITMLNKTAERLFSISRHNAIGKDYMSIFGSDECLLDETLKKGRTIEDIIRTYQRLDGEQLSLSISTATLFGRRGHQELTPDATIITGAVAVIRDVTKIKRMEDAMRRKDRLSALGDMAAGVAHEIRNPLNAIALTAHRLEEEFVGVDAKGFIKIIKDETQRLNRIIEQFLSLARPMRLELSDVDINRLIDELISLIESEAIAQNITIKKRFVGITSAEKPLLVEIDRDEIKQALLNIMRNGIEAMNSGGSTSGSELTITTELSLLSEPQMVVIKITDTGCGIAKEDLPKIFRPYFSRKDKGTGLGLSIAHRIITEHRGTIEVDSTEGVGTTFTITLPLRQ